MKKIKLPIKNIETNIILNALIQFKNDKSAIYIIGGNFGNCHLYQKLKVIMNQ